MKLVSDYLDSFDLDFLKAALALVDTRLDRLDKEAEENSDWIDPDSSGNLDHTEYIIGFGFVACQMYTTAIISRRKIAKGEARALGPKHRTGRSMTELINAAANYWKHSPDWSIDAPSKWKRTRSTKHSKRSKVWVSIPTGPMH